jgi:hypothetical protein
VLILCEKFTSASRAGQQRIFNKANFYREVTAIEKAFPGSTEGKVVPI